MDFLDRAIELLEEYRNTSSDGCFGGQRCGCHLCKKYFAFRRELAEYQEKAGRDALREGRIALWEN